MLELLWFLLPVAALSGWLVGRRERPDAGDPAEHRFSNEYFQGLNYLLNEEPDKAIEVFTRMAEVDTDTVETHLALGNLFRRRGEVDRAIRIHQNLIARPSLERRQRAYALLELGRDYLRAGLLDRAESLFEEVVELEDHAENALRHLLDVYQQEKEWERAIGVASRLESVTRQDMRVIKAQFVCEQAEEALRDGSAPARVRTLTKRALGIDSGCVRASLLRGGLEQREGGDAKAAIKTYQQVKNQDLEYLPEVLRPLESCYRRLDRIPALKRYLYRLLGDYDGVSVVMMLSELIRERDGRQAAIEFMASQLRRRPSVRGLNRLIELNIDDNDADRRRQRDLRVLQELFSALLRDRARYRCHECGFEAQLLHWHCPSCRAWASIKPVKGLQGE